MYYALLGDLRGGEGKTSCPFGIWLSQGPLPSDSDGLLQQRVGLVEYQVLGHLPKPL